MHIICPKHHYQIKISKKLIIINKKIMKHSLTAAAKNVLSPISDRTVMASDLVKPLIHQKRIFRIYFYPQAKVSININLINEQITCTTELIFDMLQRTERVTISLYALQRSSDSLSLSVSLALYIYII